MKMGPEAPLPLPDNVTDTEAFVESLLRFVTTSHLLQRLCGGVHILDFFTRSPDLYSQILAPDWRQWFATQDIHDVLEFFMRADLDSISQKPASMGTSPPESLLQYVADIRRHSLKRSWRSRSSQDNGSATADTGSLPRHIAVGMKVKKIHEVAHFADYIDRLTTDVAAARGSPVTHVVDFGSGQNYLGRTLASQPYNKHIIAVEGREHNIKGARDFDIKAKLVAKPMILRNKKLYRAAQQTPASGEAEKCPDSPRRAQCLACRQGSMCERTLPPKTMGNDGTNTPDEPVLVNVEQSKDGSGSVQYVSKRLEDGELSSVLPTVVDSSATASIAGEDLDSVTNSGSGKTRISTDPSLMVISIHSCGNLSHHGLRSLTLNPQVHAVALIGCCYNLLTERLGEATYKIPGLRSYHPRLESTTNARDPHGFPMSSRFADYTLPDGSHGIRQNITARMMAVQAPQNWARDESEAFFTRHFYRALLQRIFMDRDVVKPPEDSFDPHDRNHPCSPAGTGTGGTDPLIIGSLPKHCYTSFTAYVRGAVKKLSRDPVKGDWLKEKMDNMTDADIERYEREYGERKKELSVTWSLMAFSAGVIESLIVVDRWLWLKEQPQVSDAWVEPVFDYKLSPRNLVVVGIKK